MLVSNFDVMGLRTKREITIENFKGLGKLIVPKGTMVIINSDVSKDGRSILVDAYLRPDAVFYGVPMGADDVEPTSATAPE